MANCRHRSWLAPPVPACAVDVIVHGHDTARHKVVMNAARRVGHDEDPNAEVGSDLHRSDHGLPIMVFVVVQSSLEDQGRVTRPSWPSVKQPL